MPASWKVLSFLRECFSVPPKPTGLPNTYKRLDEKVQQPDVFDPALKQFSRAFRRGDPVFTDAETARRWRDARRRAIDHILRIVCESSWREHLVLRGSLVLKAWLGDAAREPGDMDWVITPSSIQMKDRWSKQMFSGVVSRVSDEPRFDEIEIDVAGIAGDDIWTYERAPGRRIVFPWRSPELPGGIVQLDFVFEEAMACAPVDVDIPRSTGGFTRARCASKEQSLAWKLLWLATDSCPQGKDLYDAVLLAEQTVLPLDVLRQTLNDAAGFRTADLSADLPLTWHVDWDNFKREYPWIAGDAIEWHRRLATALKSTFQNPQ